MKKIFETIVVEGKDDESAILRSVDANVICTHGYGISENTLSLIKNAYENTGIIIFTDPDHAGLSIRRKLLSLFPKAKEAFLTESQATKDDDIGIENASPKDIERALTAIATESSKCDEITMDDMIDLGLAGLADSAKRREVLGSKLGIGYANTKTFLKRLNYMGISVERIKSEI